MAATSLLLLSAVDPRLTAPAVPAADVEPTTPAVIPIRPKRAETDAGPNLLVRKGDFWEVSFKGRTISVKHGDGVARLAFLLSHPGQTFTPAEVLAGTGAYLPAPPVELDRDTDGMHEEGTASADPIVDRKALREYNAAIKRLDGEIAAARAAGNDLLAMAKETEREQIRSYRDAATGPGNRIQSFPDTRSRKDDSVYRSLHRLVLAIQQRHPAFGMHLRQTLKHGVSNGYLPEGDVRWVVESLSNAA